MKVDSIVPPEAGKSHPEALWSLGIKSMRAGQNLHFFRQPVQPLWEDPYNRTGGRLTLSPSPNVIDVLFIRLLLLLAGSSLEHTAHSLLNDPEYQPPPPPTPSSRAGKKPPEGTGGVVAGLVASRRDRGNRIELWLTGSRVGEGPAMEWVERVKVALARAGIKVRCSVCLCLCGEDGI
ncbi:hypothetical protein BT69DRAFT_1276518 [Atractiella rhizophila]|nr:hypothetical protein BT69DRAFT_1276518 [Atractiella rhizophila]